MHTLKQALGKVQSVYNQTVKQSHAEQHKCTNAGPVFQAWIKLKPRLKSFFNGDLH